jgi:hypothetical protein
MGLRVTALKQPDAEAKVSVNVELARRVVGRGDLRKLSPVFVLS